MRKDKQAYYERTGNLEQMRLLNEKLERILVEKQDISSCAPSREITGAFTSST